MIKHRTSVTATVTDAGGIDDTNEDEKASKTSDEGKHELRIFPQKPDITINNEDGSVIITPIDKDKDRIAKKLDITNTSWNN